MRLTGHDDDAINAVNRIGGATLAKYNSLIGGINKTKYITDPKLPSAIMALSEIQSNDKVPIAERQEAALAYTQLFAMATGLGVGSGIPKPVDNTQNVARELDDAKANLSVLTDGVPVPGATSQTVKTQLGQPLAPVAAPTEANGRNPSLYRVGPQGGDAEKHAPVAAAKAKIGAANAARMQCTELKPCYPL